MAKKETGRDYKMTDAEVLREIRADIRGLHKRVDHFIETNHEAHVDIQKTVGDAVSEMKERTSVNATKIGLFVGFVSLLVAGASSFVIQAVAG